MSSDSNEHFNTTTTIPPSSVFAFSWFFLGYYLSGTRPSSPNTGPGTSSPSSSAESVSLLLPYSFHSFHQIPTPSPNIHRRSWTHQLCRPRSIEQTSNKSTEITKTLKNFQLESIQSFATSFIPKLTSPPKLPLLFTQLDLNHRYQSSSKVI